MVLTEAAGAGLTGGAACVQQCMHCRVDGFSDWPTDVARCQRSPIAFLSKSTYRKGVSGLQHHHTSVNIRLRGRSATCPRSKFGSVQQGFHPLFSCLSGRKHMHPPKVHIHPSHSSIFGCNESPGQRSGCSAQVVECRSHPPGGARENVLQCILFRLQQLTSR